MKKKTRNTIIKVIFEFVIVFLGVLGAFIVERRAQSIQSKENEIQILETISESIKQDTLRFSYLLRSNYFQERLIFSRGFNLRWFPKGDAPSDSLQLLLCYMTLPLIEIDAINYQVIEKIGQMNEVKNQNLKFKILEYYQSAEEFVEDVKRLERTNSDLIFRTLDIDQFQFYGNQWKNGDPKLNPSLKRKTVKIKDFMNIELRNRSLLFNEAVTEAQDESLYQKLAAQKLLLAINKELAKLR